MMAAFSLSELVRHVPPPKVPVNPLAPWTLEETESRLGFALPSDYVAVLNAYGDGCWQGFWYLLNPVSLNGHLNLLHHACLKGERSTLWAEREARRANPNLYPWPIWPEAGGLFPWAITDNGGRFFWVTDGPPQNWASVYFPDRSLDSVAVQQGVGAILLNLLSGALPLFREELGEARLGEAPDFKPLDDSSDRVDG